LFFKIRAASLSKGLNSFVFLSSRGLAHGDCFKWGKNMLCRKEFVFFLFVLFATPLFAMSSEDEENTATSSTPSREYQEKMNRGSVKIREKLSRLKPLRTKKHRSIVSNDNTYQTLKMDLVFQSQQIRPLEAFFIHGASSGLFFRHKSREQDDFFEKLETLYNIELKHLPLLVMGAEASDKETPFSKDMPAFLDAYQIFFKSLELIFAQAKQDIESKNSYFNQFSEGFKKGKETETEVRPPSDEKGSADTRLYTTRHVETMVKQLYNQYQFFSKTLPIFQLMFEKQLFMRQRIGIGTELFITESKKKNEYSYFYQVDKQEHLRKTMEHLLEEYQGIIVPLNSILEHHKKDPIQMDSMLFEAKVLGTHSFTLFRTLAEEHADKPGSKELEKEISALERQHENLQMKAAAWLVNPKAIEWKGDESPPVPPSPPASRIDAARHKLAELKVRTLSKMSLHESEPEEENPKKKKRKSRKKEKAL
jgi:hypothetical protein